MSKDFMNECAQVARRVNALISEGKRDTAGLVLAVEAEQIGKACGVGYADAKQTIGFYLSISRAPMEAVGL